MKLSLVIPYYNRRDKLINVLESIDYSYVFEVIIVDDGSNEENKVFDLDYPKTKVVRIEKTGWRGAAVAYNTGFQEAKGDVIMINSSECVHIGNIVKYIYEFFNPDSYMAFSALMGSQVIDVNDLPIHYPNPFLNKIKEIDSEFELPSQRTWWGVSRSIGNFIPYCAVISRENMIKLGGYDLRFLGGVGYDDYDFTHRVKNLGLKMICIDRPFVFHQWHKPTDYPNMKNLDLLNELNNKFPYRIKVNEDIYPDWY